MQKEFSMSITQNIGYTLSFVHKNWLTVGTFVPSFHSVEEYSCKPNRKRFTKKMVGDVLVYFKRR